MHRLAPVVVLLLTSCVLTESASAQLFRRARRNTRSRGCCCCCPTHKSPVVNYSVTPAPVPADANALDPTTASSPTLVPLAKTESPAADNAAVESTSLSATDSADPVDRESIDSPSDVPAAPTAAQDDASPWKSLFDGKTLGKWEITKFGGEGDVVVEDGQITCDFGQYITGVTYKGKDLPTNNYEIELEAMRIDGTDFFCGLTFPVDDKHATFVVGGWGGSVTGISSIDSYDASENDTTDFLEFDNKRWYTIRVRVTEGVLEAWIDKKKMVSKLVESSRLSTRIEMDPSKPWGICCFDTKAAYRNIRIRPETKPDMEISE